MNHFTEAAKTWDTDEKAIRNKALAEAIKKHLNLVQGSYIDFGCGTGLLSEHFVEKANYLLGVDTTKEMLDAFDKKFEKFDQVESCDKNLETQDFSRLMDHIDAIFSAMAFHHLERPEKVLAKLSKVLNESGKIFVIDLLKEDGSFHPDNSKMGVKHFGFDKDDLISWTDGLELKLSGFEIIFNIHKNGRDYPLFMGIFEK